MCHEYIDILKQIQTIEDTISDLESEMMNYSYDSKEMDIIFDKLEVQEKHLNLALFRKAEFDKWCMNHHSITKQETEKDWYVECQDQLKLEV